MLNEPLEPHFELLEVPAASKDSVVPLGTLRKVVNIRHDYTVPNRQFTLYGIGKLPKQTMQRALSLTKR
jgi:hypothetical protein